jgi:hypothetical protein
MAAYLAATMPQSAGQTINVLDNEHTTMDEFYRILARIYLPQKTFRTIALPFWVGYVVGGIVSGISNLLNLDHPFMDPSLYALYAVSRNLDFSNGKLRELAATAERQMVTLDQGVQELAQKERNETH